MEDREDLFYFLCGADSIQTPDVTESPIEVCEEGKLVDCLPTFQTDKKDVKKSIAAFQTCKQVFHPNHLGVHQMYKSLNSLFFVYDRPYFNLTELLSKFKSLKQLEFSKLFPKTEHKVSANVVYDESFVRKIAHSLLNFLSYLHSQGIVFANLQPSNIVLSSNNEICILTCLEMSRSKTKTNLLFCAPEVLKQQRYSSASDIFSAGVVLHILLFGKFPFSIDSEEFFKQELLNKQMDTPRENSPRFSPYASNLVFSMLSRNEEERPSAMDCLSDSWFNDKQEGKQISQDSNENWFSKLPHKICETLNTLSNLKFSKNIKAKFSMVSDVLFEKKRENEDTIPSFGVSPKKKKFSLATNVTNVAPSKLLVFGLRKSGSEKFAEKLIGLLPKAFNRNTENYYLNGQTLTTHTIHTSENTVHSVSLLRVNENSFIPTQQKGNFEDCEEMEGSSSRPVQAKKPSHPVHDSSEPLNFSSLINKQVDTFFDWGEVNWHQDFADTNSIIFFANCNNFIDDERVDENTLNCFKLLLSSPIFSDRKCIYGNTPILILISNIEARPNINRESITRKFLSLIPQISFDVRSQVVFSNEDYNGAAILFNINQILHLLSEQSNLFTYFKQISKINLHSLILRNLQNCKFTSVTKMLFCSKVMALESLQRLEIVDFKDIFRQKNLDLILDTIKKSNIKSLLFARSNGPFDSIEKLTQLLQSKQSKLESVKLIDLQLKTEEIQRIITSLYSNYSITSLDLSRNKFSSFNLAKLVDLLLHQDNLCHVFISNCGLIEQDMGVYLPNLLSFSNSLLTLDISGNCASAFFLKTLLNKIEANSSLPLCNFSFDLSINSEVVIDRANQILARNRRNILRYEIGSYLFDQSIYKSQEKWKLLHSLSPYSPLNSCVVGKLVAHNRSDDVEEFGSPREKEIIVISKGKKTSTEGATKKETTLKNLAIYDFFERKETHVTEASKIDLSWFGLKEESIPSTIFSLEYQGFFLSGLKSLDLSQNLIAKVPEEIYNLKMLEELSLAVNNIQKLDEEICGLSNLTRLDLRENHLVSLPSSFSQLTNLKILFLQHNHIHTLPDFSNMTKLDTLTLHDNLLYQLSFPLFEINSLNCLTIGGNMVHQLKQICMESWAKKVTTLDLSKMRIEHLPHEISLLSHLTNLDLRDNQLQHLPPNIGGLTKLQTLDLRNNHLVELPVQLCPVLLSLEVLHVFGNFRLSLPNEISVLQDKPVSKKQFPILIDFIDKNSQQISDKCFLSVCVVVEEEEDFGRMSSLLSAQKPLPKKEPLVNDQPRPRRGSFDEVSPSLHRLVSYASQTDVFKEIPIKISDDMSDVPITDILKSMDRLKMTQIQEKMYSEIDLEEQKMFLRLFGFSTNEPTLTHFVPLLGSASQHVFVLFTTLSEDLQVVASLLQTIRAVSANPVLVLGRNRHAYDKKQRTKIEEAAHKKLSRFFPNVKAVKFLSFDSSKWLMDALTNLSSKLSKRTYFQEQAEYLLQAEASLSNLPIMRLEDLERIVRPCIGESLYCVVKSLQASGEIYCFESTLWKSNDLVLIKPYLLISIIRDALVQSSATGFLNASEFISSLFSLHNLLIFDPNWTSGIISFLQKLDVTLNVPLNDSLKQQFRKTLFKMESSDYSKLIFVPNNLKPSPHKWQDIKDLWSAFPSISTPKAPSSPESLEKWFFLAVPPTFFFNKICMLVLQASFVQPLRIWSDMILCTAGQNTSFLLANQQVEKGGSVVKMRICGSEAFKYFFFLNELVKMSISREVRGCKMPTHYSAVPLDCSDESFVKTKTLESILSEGKSLSLQCHSCAEDAIKHVLHVNAIAPFLTLKHLSHLQLLEENVSSKQEIARGSAGVVYRAILYPTSPVAVKQVHSANEDVSQEEILCQMEGWRREVNILSLLSGKPNIVQMRGFIVSPPSLVLELAPQGNLFNFLRSGKTHSFSVEDCLTLTEQMANALNVLHTFEVKIIHRDLKSLNVLVMSVYPLHIKLTDFETACLASPFAKGRNEIDNPKWTAPELISGIRYDEKVDIYSLGVVMWEMTTKKIPFEDCQLFSSELELQIIENDLRPTVNPAEWDNNYLQLTKCCWDRNPSKRPSAEEVLACVSKLKKGQQFDFSSMTKSAPKEQAIETIVEEKIDEILEKKRPRKFAPFNRNSTQITQELKNSRDTVDTFFNDSPPLNKSQRRINLSKGFKSLRVSDKSKNISLQVLKSRDLSFSQITKLDFSLQELAIEKEQNHSEEVIPGLHLSERDLISVDSEMETSEEHEKDDKEDSVKFKELQEKSSDTNDS